VEDLLDGLKQLSMSVPLVACITGASGEHVIAGCGELRVEICLQDLRDECEQCGFTVSDPVVSCRETLTETYLVCLGTSPNKHNHSYMAAEPTPEEPCVLSKQL